MHIAQRASHLVERARESHPYSCSNVFAIVPLALECLATRDFAFDFPYNIFKISTHSCNAGTDPAQPTACQLHHAELFWLGIVQNYVSLSDIGNNGKRQTNGI